MLGLRHPATLQGYLQYEDTSFNQDTTQRSVQNYPWNEDTSFNQNTKQLPSFMEESRDISFNWLHPTPPSLDPGRAEGGDQLQPFE